VSEESVAMKAGLNGRVLMPLLTTGLVALWKGYPTEGARTRAVETLSVWAPVFQIALLSVTLGVVAIVGVEVPSLRLLGGALVASGFVATLGGFVMAVGVASRGPSALYTGARTEWGPSLTEAGTSAWAARSDENELVGVLECNGRLAVIAMGAPSASLVEEVAALGEVAWVVAPSAAIAGHISAWSEHFSRATVVTAEAPAECGFSIHPVGMDEAAVFHEVSGTLWLDAGVRCLRPNDVHAWTDRWLAKLAMVLGRPSISLEQRLAAQADVGEVKTLAALPISKLMLVTGPSLDKVAPGMLFRVLA
jgi:hypothetical protein